MTTTAVEPGFSAEAGDWVEECYFSPEDDLGPEDPAYFSNEVIPADILAELEPGPELATILSAIAVENVDEYAAVEVVAAYKRLEAWAAAGAAKAAGNLARRDILNFTHPLSGEELEFTGAELGMRLGITRAQARELMDVGRAAFNDGAFTDTGQALHQGRLDWRKAATIITTLAHHPDQVSWFAQHEVLPRAGQRTHAQLVRDLNKALIAVDGVEAQWRNRRATTKRHVNHPRPLPDGMASIYAVLPATDAVSLDLSLEAAARAARTAGDTRTTDQLRADALALMGHTARTTGWIGTPPTTTTPPGGPDDPPGTTDHTDHQTPQESSRTDGDTDEQTPQQQPAGTDGDADGQPPQQEPRRWPGPDGDLDEEALRSWAQLSGPGTIPAEQAPLPPIQDLPYPPPKPPMPLATGPRTQINVTIPLAVLLPPPKPPTTTPPGAPPPQPSDAVGDEPIQPVATLTGYGPITPEVARALALGGTWRRLITDPTSGTILDIGRTTYRPPEDLARHVRHQNTTCIRPGCTVPADQCDLDHTIPWSQGGTTSTHNLKPMCTTDHTAKTAGLITITQPAPGVLLWHTPTGHTYQRHPDGTATPLGRTHPHQPNP